MLTPSPQAPIDPTAAWHHVAAWLRDHPDQPQLIRECPSAGTAKRTAWDIRTGAIKAFRCGGYTARSSGQSVWAVYGAFPDRFDEENHA